MGIERKTVDTHVSNMLGKLGMVTRREMQVLFESTWN
jgi:DNA-binding CsgD family transcriptional regulator